MADETTGNAERDRRMGQVLAAYFEALDAGQAPDREALLREHPDLAEDLAEYFARHDQFDHLVGPLRPVVQASQPDTQAMTQVDTEVTAEYRAPRTDPSETTQPGTEETLPASSSPVDDLPGTAGGDDRGNGDGDDGGAGDTSDPDLPRGARLRYFGDYELMRVLGRGGMGIVHQARQVSLNRPVALKMIRAGDLAGDDDLRRFRIEAEAVATLDDPHIVPVYEVGEHSGRRYFSMKLIAGGSLAGRLADFAADPRAAARLVAAVARAVRHAHQRGILHRDLKPANILIDEQGRPHVTDFGLAKRVEADEGLTLSGAVMGTPGYMAPEQASGRRAAITTAVDVYGLGAILYALLAGRAPFVGDSVLSVLEQVRDRPPGRPAQLSRRVPRDLEVICLKCLEKDPRRRYDSAAALADDLERHLAGEPIRARRASALEYTVKWARRRPAVAALLGSIVVVAALAFSGITWAWRVAEAALRELEVKSYSDNIALAEREWRSNNVVRARERLEACPPHLRDWEWHCVKRLCLGNPMTLHGALYDVAYSPDGTRIASSGGDMVRVWDAQARHEIFTLRAPKEAGGPTGVAFGPDGERIASATGSGAVVVWDATTGQVLLTFRGHNQRGHSVAFSPDQRRLASAGGDGTVRVWDVSTGRPLLTLRGHVGEVSEVAFSPDGKRLASGGKDKTIRVWDVDTGRGLMTLGKHTDEVRDVAYSPDGRWLASAGFDSRVIVWDATTGRSVRTFENHAGTVRSVAFSSDGRHLASASHDKSVKVWDLTTGREAITLHLARPATGVAFHPDGLRLASTSLDGTVRVWDGTPLPPGRTGQEAATLRGHDGSVLGLAYSPDGMRIATCGRDPLVRIWDAATGEPLPALRGHPGHVLSLAYSPDGRHLASAGWDRAVRVWDATTGRELLTLWGHTNVVWSVVFSPDGELIASGGFDGSVRVWDAETGRGRLTLRHASATSGLTFSPDGTRLASSTNDGTVKLWDATPWVSQPPREDPGPSR